MSFQGRYISMNRANVTIDSNIPDVVFKMPPPFLSNKNRIHILKKKRD
jgi:hypothetical protein